MLIFNTFNKNIFDAHSHSYESMTRLRVIPPHFLDIMIPQFEFLNPAIWVLNQSKIHVYTHIVITYIKM